MKKEKNKNREQLDIINDFQQIIKGNNYTISNDDFERINNLFDESTLISKRDKRNGIIGLTIVIGFLVGIVSLVYTMLIENEKQFDQILQKNEIIRNLQTKNEFLNSYVREELEKLSPKEKSLNEKLIEIRINNDLNIKSVYDSLFLLNNTKNLTIHSQENEIDYLENKLDLIKSTFEIYYDENGNLLSPKYDSLFFEREVYKSRLDFIKDKYGIIFTKENDVPMSKVDSAVMLFPYFKDKLNYNKDKKVWEIYIERK